MTNGKKESSKESQGLKRVSDLIPEGSSEPEYPTLKEYADIDLEVVRIKVQYGRTENVRSMVVTAIVKGKEIEIKVTQRKVIKKLMQLQESLPLRAKFVKGARVWDVV